jgi:hypothetical protein
MDPPVGFGAGLEESVVTDAFLSSGPSLAELLHAQCARTIPYPADTGGCFLPEQTLCHPSKPPATTDQTAVKIAMVTMQNAI